MIPDCCTKGMTLCFALLMLNGTAGTAASAPLRLSLLPTSPDFLFDGICALMEDRLEITSSLGMSASNEGATSIGTVSNITSSMFVHKGCTYATDGAAVL